MENLSTFSVCSNFTNQGEEIGAISIAVAYLICFWILVAHGTIVLCFVINKTKPWTTYAKQIFSLSVNDLILGVLYFFMLLSVSIGNSFTNWKACAFIVYIFISVQCACLYHVFAICAYRAKTLLKQPRNTIPVTTKLSVVFILSAWIISFSIGAVPLLIWTDSCSDIPYCSVDYLYGNYRQKVVAFYAVSYLSPLVLINVTYVFTCYKLVSVWTTVFPALDAVQDTTTNSKNETAETTLQCSRTGMKANRAAIVTIGALLLLFNLFTIPIIYNMWSEYSGNVSSRKVRAIMSVAFSMNSALNPFVYAVHTKFLRTALKQLRKDFAILCGY